MKKIDETEIDEIFTAGILFGVGIFFFVFGLLSLSDFFLAISFDIFTSSIMVFIGVLFSGLGYIFYRINKNQNGKT